MNRAKTQAKMSIAIGQRGLLQLGGSISEMRRCYHVVRPFVFAGQHIDDVLATFDTREEAQDYIVQHEGPR